MTIALRPVPDLLDLPAEMVAPLEAVSQERPLEAR